MIYKEPDNAEQRTDAVIIGWELRNVLITQIDHDIDAAGGSLACPVDADSCNCY